MTNHGSARARSLATELRSLRAGAKLTLRQVAARVDLSIATLSRVENGERPISVVDTNALLTVYGVTGANRARLLSLADEAARSNWWEAVGEVLPKHMAALIKFEADANQITHVAMLRIPGLLQTPDYARTVLRVVGVDHTKIDALVTSRMHRQAILTRQRPPKYLVIFDEMALRRVTGSRPLMAQQLDRLCEVAAYPHVEMRVIPFDIGAHPGLDGSFVLMRFPKAKPILHVEHAKASAFEDKGETIGLFQETVDSLLAVSLGSADSVKFLRRLAEDFRRE